MNDYSIRRRRHIVFKDPKPKPMDIPPDAVQIASLSAITTIIVTIAYMILYIIYLTCRFKRSTDIEGLSGSNYFVYVLREVYIKEQHSINGLPAYLTKSITIYKFILIALSMSIVSLICAASLLWTTFDKKQSHYFVLMAYLGVIPFICCLAIDINLAFLFGWDYSNLSQLLDRKFAGLNENYTMDTIRLVALFLMTLALKGYVLYLIQATFLAILVVKAYQMGTALEHPMNRMSVLKACENGLDKEKREAERHQRELNYLRGLKKTRYDEKTGQAVTEFGTSRRGAIDDKYQSRLKKTRYYEETGQAVTEFGRRHSRRGAIDDKYQSRLKKTRYDEKTGQAVTEFGTSRRGAIDDEISNYSGRSFEPVPGSKKVHWHPDVISSTLPARAPMAMELVPIPAPDYSPEPARRLKPALKTTDSYLQPLFTLRDTRI